MIDKYITNLIKYYNIASKKVQLDINKLLTKYNKDGKLSQKELTRLKKYNFRYKMIIESNHINTQSRLNKLTRSPLTTPNSNTI
jgi:hypothetical protein